VLDYKILIDCQGSLSPCFFLVIYKKLNNKKTNSINMASQILSGSSNPTYTNNTGQNVRVVINHMANLQSMTWAGNTVSVPQVNFSAQYLLSTNIFGAYAGQQASFNCGVTISSNTNIGNTYIDSGAGQGGTFIDLFSFGAGSQGDFKSRYYYNSGGTAGYLNNFIRVTLPTKIFLGPGEQFSAICGPYNIVVIREDGT